MPTRAHADLLLFNQGLAESAAQAASLIMAGRVAIASDRPEPEKVLKAGQQLPITTHFHILPGKNWASRGALKLLTLLENYPINLEDKVCVDAGASTGGFTDCLLKQGASKVYAIDVGRNLLHEKLRNDPRVINMEGINIRTAPASLLPEKADFIAADLSFISLTACVPSFLPWLKPSSLLALLVKPQFELAPRQMTRGVVRNDEFRMLALQRLVTFCEEKCGLEKLFTIPAAIKGPKGNQEFMALFRSASENRQESGKP